MSDRRFLGALRDPSDSVFVTGSQEEQATAREEWRRQRFIAELMKSNLPEIPRSRLDFGRHTITDTATGDLYRACQGELTRPQLHACCRLLLGGVGQPDPARAAGRAEDSRRARGKARGA